MRHRRRDCGYSDSSFSASDCDPTRVRWSPTCLRENVELKVLSGDAPETVAAIARDAGLTVNGPALTGAELPADPEQLRDVALRTTVVGRISPDDKRRFVQALADAGRYVAMVGDGVNDVPALKASRLAIAQGTGAQMAKSVADLVLVRGSFAVVPPMVEQGREALRNLQRVAKLYVTKSSFAAFLILLIGTTSTAYPLLPRHFSLAATITIGIPTFFLALAPSSGPWRSPSFARDVARFAVPAGTLIGVGVLASYLFALHPLKLPLIEARTAAITVLIVLGLYLILVLEATGFRRRTIVSLAITALAALYVLVLVIPPVRNFFALAPPNPEHRRDRPRRKRALTGRARSQRLHTRSSRHADTTAAAPRRARTDSQGLSRRAARELRR